MNTAELIYEKSKQLPESLAHQVLDYLEFLEIKYQQEIESETLYVLQNNALMQQIKESEKTFSNKTGFIPSEEQLNALD
ncbi:MAG: DUF2281 domain-containing protein [Methylococcales bacterium]